MSRTKSRFKEEYERENFTVRVDITHLYKLQLEANALLDLTKRIRNPRLKTSAENINFLCAVMRGDVVIVDLKGERIAAPAMLRSEGEQ